MTFIIPAPEQASIAVDGTNDRFPVRRIFCVGRNYAAHAREMGKDPDREPPFFFTKPADAVVDTPATIPYPPETANLHYEIELVVGIGKQAFQVAPEATDELIAGYAVGLDMTRRDLQQSAKDMGRPWDWGKAFDQSAPCGPLYRVADTGLINTGRIWLSVNGEQRQVGDIADLIWPIPELLSLLSHSMRLMPGDLVMTGTPAGVGPVVTGDVITGGVAGLGDIEVVIGAAEGS
ncbi:MAG: fumarylacetoacetate hydrolase family protein [Rhizobiales bacterium]|nr:fumarylacetoacetate hydrolase family protein [Hyphomicrobiales bacterium]